MLKFVSPFSSLLTKGELKFQFLHWPVADNYQHRPLQPGPVEPVEGERVGGPQGGEVVGQTAQGGRQGVLRRGTRHTQP